MASKWPFGPAQRLAFWLVVLLTTAGDSWAAGTANFMLQADIRGRRVEGMPLAWSDSEVYLLARDGYLWEFQPSEAKNFRKSAAQFRSYSAGQLSAALEAELGGKLQITGTGHYLVAHPPGRGAQWAQRFEDLYRSFVHYFAVRGLRIQEPKFPLVAIVWPTQLDFMRYSASEGHPPNPNVLGYYSPVSNRITLYDSGSLSKKDWQQNAETIIHEAAHQTAFNTGVHSRFALPPRWIAEGLGTLYEAAGVYDSRNNPHQGQRINRGRLEQFRSLIAAGRPPGLFVDLITSDRLFEKNPAVAYAEAWAFTFFLSETEPRKYVQLLTKTANRPDFKDYSQAARLADFTAIFGKDFRMMDANFLRFIAGLK